MARILVSRTLQFVVIAVGLATVLFFALRASGDPARMILGLDAPDEAVRVLRERLGLDRPLHIQYFDFMYRLFPHVSGGRFQVLDFGRSLKGPEHALDMALGRFPYTLALGGLAFLISILLSVPFGILTALYRRGFANTLILIVALVGQTVPNFVLAIVLAFLFGVYFGILPIFGFEGWRSIILPAVAMAAFPLARLTRLLSSQILETLPQDYIRTAYAKGLSKRTVVTRHVLRNALLPYVTMLGLDFGRLMGGSIIVETVFAYPGIGQQLITRISQRDYPVVQADIFLIAMVVVAGNLIADLSYRWLDPRIREAD
ncbi:MAG: ABC transporter permease [Chloroflexi bacterium]|nr:ABC transporter permease [Chloroflexota bacterium]